MNLPNRLTVLRVVLIPLFMLLFYLAEAELLRYGYFLSLVVFGAAAFTDLLDGKIARERGLVTDFGKLMDPLADKLLVMAAMLCLAGINLVHPVIVFVILAREFLVTSIRLVAASNSVVIAADGWGKAKTVTQMIWISYGLLLLSLIAYGLTLPVWLTVIYNALLVAVIALTAVSGANYVWKNRAMFRDL